MAKKQESNYTTVYFVRHAQPNFHNHDDMTRELTDKGMEDSKRVTRYLSDKKIDTVLPSPYKRSVDTVKDFADAYNLKIHIIDDFRERKVGNKWIEDFDSFCKKQWEDFTYKLSDGESLREVQERNISALSRVLSEHEGENIVIGTHGTALSTIINYYDISFGFMEFQRIKDLMPWVVKFTFNKSECLNYKSIDLFYTIF